MWGIEPRPRQWECRILTTRPHGIALKELLFRTWFWAEKAISGGFGVLFSQYEQCNTILTLKLIWFFCLPRPLEVLRMKTVRVNVSQTHCLWNLTVWNGLKQYFELPTQHVAGLPEPGLFCSCTTPVMKLWDAHLIRRTKCFHGYAPSSLCACVCLSMWFFCCRQSMATFVWDCRHN